MGRFVRVASMIVLLHAGAGRAAAQEEPRVVVERAIQAHGGGERLSRARAGQSRSRGTIHLQSGIEFTAESYTQLPDRFKNVMQFSAMNASYVQTQVLDGDKAWLHVNGRTQELDARAVAEMKENLYAERVAGLIVLRETGYELTSLPEVVVNGRLAVGVKVASAGHREVALYFDKASGLLVKAVSRLHDPAGGRDVSQEKTYSSYKELDGILRPTRVAVVRDGQPYLDIEVLEHKTVDKFPESVFALP
jgi:hypothetical protein